MPSMSSVPYQMARAAAPHMRRGGNGAIVNVSSVGSLNGNGSSYSYVTSKAALNTLTLALARNLAPEIRVNCVLPGLIETRWLKVGLGDEAYQRVRDGWADAAALQKPARPRTSHRQSCGSPMMRRSSPGSF